jgi:hypothetical protein
MISALAPTRYEETLRREVYAEDASTRLDLKVDLDRWENEGGRAIALKNSERPTEEQQRHDDLYPRTQC